MEKILEEVYLENPVWDLKLEKGISGDNARLILVRFFVGVENEILECSDTGSA